MQCGRKTSEKYKVSTKNRNQTEKNLTNQESENHMKRVDSMQIIPMRDLKNTVEVERRCAEENGPIFVTKNGYGRLVVMDIDYYEKTMRKMYEAKTILDGLEDVKSGNTVDADAALSSIRSKYGI